jgi:hypothetical protein
MRLVAILLGGHDDWSHLSVWEDENDCCKPEDEDGVSSLVYIREATSMLLGFFSLQQLFFAQQS